MWLKHKFVDFYLKSKELHKNINETDNEFPFLISYWFLRLQCHRLKSIYLASCPYVRSIIERIRLLQPLPNIGSHCVALLECIAVFARKS